jgi:tRNA(His) 5'-end guanylyltransferase
LAYTQSDEISLLLIDYEKNESQQWFQNSLQKMVSVAASMATLAFNNEYRLAISALADQQEASIEDIADAIGCYFDKHGNFKNALFDARAFTLPKEEVCNYFIWRQQDASRNSVQMVAQSLFSHKQLHGKNTGELQDMMFTEHGVNWNDYTTHQKRGACIVKEQYDKDGAMRSRWVPDLEIPIFTQNRDYIDKYVFV